MTRLGPTAGWLARSSGTVLTLFLAALVLDIGGAIGVKYAAGVLLAGFVLVHWRRFEGLRTLWRVEFPLFALAPLGLAVLTILIRDVPVGTVARQLVYLSVWLLFPLATTLSSSEVTDRFLGVLWWASWLTLGTFVLLAGLMVVGNDKAVESITLFTDSYRLGNIGEKPVRHLGIGYIPTTYYGWSMWLIPASILAFGLKPRLFPNLIAAAMAVLSLGITAATSFGLAVCTIAGPSRLRRRLVVVASVVGVLTIAAIGTGYGPFLSWLISKLSPASPSTAHKLSLVRKALEVMHDTQAGYWIGTGIGSAFYPQGLDRPQVVIEVGPISMVRQYGVPYVLAFAGYVGWVVIGLVRQGGTGLYWGVALASLLLATCTNPFLISPVFFTVLVLARAVLYHLDQEAGDNALPSCGEKS